MEKPVVKIEDIKKIAELLGIDPEEPLPDFSDPQLIRSLGNRFTDDCLEELEMQERAELESMAHAHSVPIWG